MHNYMVIQNHYSYSQEIYTSITNKATGNSLTSPRNGSWLHYYESRRLHSHRSTDSISRFRTTKGCISEPTRVNKRTVTKQERIRRYRSPCSRFWIYLIIYMFFNAADPIGIYLLKISNTYKNIGTKCLRPIKC